MKLAVAIFPASIFTVQVPVPVQGPDHPENVDPGDADAVSVTEVPGANAAEQAYPQLIPEGLDTTVPLPVPDFATLSQNVAPFWLTVNVWPPTVIVPVLGSPAVFATAVYETVPLPVPVLPEGMEIQGALLTAVQGQPKGAVTVICPVVPYDSTEAAAGAIEYVHAWELLA
ncbi:MAG TPA: hypothetical protein VLS90_08270 [Thermodesulfobacteriota bacterium]|nr:hypothetical protein [Thermodesulfobacteriota bacterium]